MSVISVPMIEKLGCKADTLKSYLHRSVSLGFGGALNKVAGGSNKLASIVVAMASRFDRADQMSSSDVANVLDEMSTRKRRRMSSSTQSSDTDATLLTTTSPEKTPTIVSPGDAVATDSKAASSAANAADVVAAATGAPGASAAATGSDATGQADAAAAAKAAGVAAAAARGATVPTTAAGADATAQVKTLAATAVGADLVRGAGTLEKVTTGSPSSFSSAAAKGAAPPVDLSLVTIASHKKDYMVLGRLLEGT
jgi:hypothetical protein